MSDRLREIIFELDEVLGSINIETERNEALTRTVLTGYFQELIPDKVSARGDHNDNTLIITSFKKNRIFTEIAHEKSVRATELLKKASDLVNELAVFLGEGE